MKILQILPALSQGGVELCVIETVIALRERQVDVSVISSGGKLVSKLEELGVHHSEFPLAKKNLYSLIHYKQLATMINKMSPDLIHVHSRWPAWLLYLARQHFKQPIPIITTVHGLNSVSFYSRIMTRFQGIIAVSYTTRDYLIKHYAIDPNRITVITPGVDTQQFTPRNTATPRTTERLLNLSPELNQPFILLPGRITRRKGHVDLIPIMQKVIETRPNTRALIVGGGSEKAILQLKADIQKAQLHQHIFYFGSSDDMSGLYTRAGVVLSLSTLPESYGRTAMEALASNIPVVGYQHGGVGENLARYFPYGQTEMHNYTQAAEKIITCLEHPPAILPIDDTLYLAQKKLYDYYQSYIK